MSSVFLKNIDHSIYRNKFFFILKDIKPKAKTHWLLIPINLYKDLTDFSINSSIEEKLLLYETISHISKILKNRFKFLTNNEFSQEVFHLHFHILSDIEISSKLD